MPPNEFSMERKIERRERHRMTTYTGGCHCGDLAIEYKTALQPGDWPLRECQCSFCRKHAMLNTSDPDGKALIVVRNPASLRRYRFATGVTDFLICANSGVYIGATMMKDGWVVLDRSCAHTRSRLTSSSCARRKCSMHCCSRSLNGSWDIHDSPRLRHGLAAVRSFTALRHCRKDCGYSSAYVCFVDERLPFDTLVKGVLPPT